jgi:hypothetical protein
MWDGHSVALDVARVGRTLLSDAFDLDLAFDFESDREGHGFSRAKAAQIEPGFSR